MISLKWSFSCFPKIRLDQYPIILHLIYISKGYLPSSPYIIYNGVDLKLNFVLVKICDFQKSMFLKDHHRNFITCKVVGCILKQTIIASSRIYDVKTTTREYPHTIISAIFTAKQIEARLKYSTVYIPLLLPFSASGEAASYVTGQLISPKNPQQKILGKFMKKTRNFSYQKKNYCYNCIFLFIQISIQWWV